MLKRKLWLAAALLAAGLLLAGCAWGGRGEKPAAAPGGGKLRVYTTVFPLYDFTRNVGGDRVEVINLLPPGADPHHWEPTPGDLLKVHKSDVFVYCGAGLERWAENVLKTAGPGKPVVVDSSRGVQVLSGYDHGEEIGQDHEENHSEDHQGADPHIWLDPVNAGIMVDNILAGLVLADPAGRDQYTAAAVNYRARLEDLDRRYREGLAPARVKRFVVSHDAFGYLAKRYGLEQVPIRGVTADAEPGPARMAEIVGIVRKQGIKYIFTESMTSPRVSEAIARETGAGLISISHIGALSEKEWKEGKSYLSLMEENLEKLIKACEAR